MNLGANGVVVGRVGLFRSLGCFGGFAFLLLQVRFTADEPGSPLFGQAVGGVDLLRLRHRVPDREEAVHLPVDRVTGGLRCGLRVGQEARHWLRRVAELLGGLTLPSDVRIAVRSVEQLLRFPEVGLDRPFQLLGSLGHLVMASTFVDLLVLLRVVETHLLHDVVKAAAVRRTEQRTADDDRAGGYDWNGH
nr:hypothetical protein [Saccharopolyspora gloriosae]